MFATLAIAVLSILPVHDGVLRDSCARIERNFFYDCEGRLVFCQLVCWDEHCIAWRLDKGQISIERDHASGGYVARFLDGEQIRYVRARSFDVSHTQVDVELEDREVWAKELRRELTNHSR